MKLLARLASLAALLLLVAGGLVYLRTDTVRAGNRLHALLRQKRDLEKACCRLEVAIARLKSPRRLRPHAAHLRAPTAPHDGVATGETEPPPLLAQETVRAPP